VRFLTVKTKVYFVLRGKKKNHLLCVVCRNAFYSDSGAVL